MHEVFWSTLPLNWFSVRQIFNTSAHFPGRLQDASVLHFAAIQKHLGFWDKAPSLSRLNWTKLVDWYSQVSLFVVYPCSDPSPYLILSADLLILYFVFLVLLKRKITMVCNFLKEIVQFICVSFNRSFSWGRSELTDRNVELYPQFFLELITTQLRFYMVSPQLSLLIILTMQSYKFYLEVSLFRKQILYL